MKMRQNLSSPLDIAGCDICNIFEILNPSSNLIATQVQVSPVIGAMLNSSAPFIVQIIHGMEWIELSWSKIAWIMVQESPDCCSI